MSGSVTRGVGENVLGISGACATRNFRYLAIGPRVSKRKTLHWMNTPQLPKDCSVRMNLEWLPVVFFNIFLWLHFRYVRLWWCHFPHFRLFCSQIVICVVKLTFGVLTLREQQHSTHDRMFLWKWQSFWDRKYLDPTWTRTPNRRIHADFRYWGQTFALPCF